LFGVTALALAGGEDNIIQPNASLVLVFVLALSFFIALPYLDALGFIAVSTSLEEASAILKRDSTKWTKVIQAAGIKAE